jgi:hypothetical protein
MTVSVELEDEIKQTYAVVLDGVCIADHCPRQKQTGSVCKSSKEK